MSAEAQQAAKAELQASLKRMFANLLRSARSDEGGAPWELVQGAREIVESAEAYKAAYGVEPDENVIREAIWVMMGSDRFERAFRTVMRGSFQMAASALMEQNTPRTRGRDEVLTGVNDIIEARRL